MRSKGANRKRGSFQLTYKNEPNKTTLRNVSLTEALRLAKRLLEDGEKEVKVVRE